MPGTAASITLAATGIVVANEWVQKDTINWRSALAGGILALAMEGAEKVSPPLATGFASIMLVVVLVTPLPGTANSPLKTLSGVLSGAKK